MRTLRFLFVKAFLIGIDAMVLLLGAMGSAHAAPPSGPNWVSIFSDEFNDPSLDRSKWDPYYTWGNPNTVNRHHNYPAWVLDENVTVKDGQLVLTAKKGSYTIDGTTYPYTSGMVTATYLHVKGKQYLEARIKMPSGYSDAWKSNGLWPAFWVSGRNGWPPEIDIWESLGGNLEYYANSFWRTSSGRRGSTNRLIQNPTQTSEFHTYGCHIHADYSSDIYLDGQHVASLPAAGPISDFVMLINFGIGSDGNGSKWGDPAPNTFPLNLYVDWVRVWEETSGSTTTSTTSASANTITTASGGDGAFIENAGMVRPKMASTNAILSNFQIFEHLKNGINMDVTPFQNSQKDTYITRYADEYKTAGFSSVRFFINPRDPAVYKQMIDDILSRGMLATPVMWAYNQGKDAFVESWENFARYYKDYPQELVFELFNEPRGCGIRDNNEAISWINAVIPAIRKISPTRILLVGGPNWNEAHKLVEFVTPTYLNYRLADGTTFETDQYLIGAYHEYWPMGFSHAEGSNVSLKSVPGWEGKIEEFMNIAVSWGKQWNKPVILTEWGVRRTKVIREDLLKYLDFVVKTAAKNNVAWQYYCGMFSDEWPISLYHNQEGWDKEALAALNLKQPASDTKK